MLRQREEVINTMLAACIARRGTAAAPETIRRGGQARPDVMATFRGLRCAFEGKVADVQNARTIVLGDAQLRVEQGIAQIAVAVVYPSHVRTTPFSELEDELSRTSELEFCITTETGAGDWQSGGVDDVLGEMRRIHEHLLGDDVVREAAQQLSVSLSEVASIFVNDGGVCDRLADLLGMGQPEAAEDAGLEDD